LFAYAQILHGGEKFVKAGEIRARPRFQCCDRVVYFAASIVRTRQKSFSRP